MKIEARLIGVFVESHIDDDLPTMYIDPSLLRQALWYLLENSLDAMADSGGTLNIKVILCWDEIHIEMTDNGRGFCDLPASKALQPFTTTRPGKMGLGLALCRQVILDHGGDIKVVNEKDQGATVIIDLPIIFKHPTEEPELPKAKINGRTNSQKSSEYHQASDTLT